MKFKVFFFISAHVIVVLLLLIFLSNPIWEQLYPRSVDDRSNNKVMAPSTTDTSEMNGIEVNAEDSSINNDKEKYSVQASRQISRNLAPIIGASRKVTLTSPTKWKKQSLSTPTNLSSALRGFLYGKIKKISKNITNNLLPSRAHSKSTTTRQNVRSKPITRPMAKIQLKKEQFTAEPKWEIEEDYALVTSSSQTSCPVSVKIKSLNSSWLRQKFLPQITIFMDNRHFSDQEWNRLEHFIPPFGWMELKYEVVQEVVSALPSLPDQQLLLAQKGNEFPRCVSCAVVGNGGILNGSGLGLEIDSHDHVFRVNGAVITGFEKDVGKRTSFYGFTAFTMLSSLYILKGKGFPNMPRSKETKYILFTEGQRDYEWLKALQQNKEISNGTLEDYRLRPRDDFEANFDLKKLLVAHPDFMRYLKNRFLRSDIVDGEHWKTYRPSTGALQLLTALHLCDTVSAYGFMTEDYNKYSDHYYDKEKTKVTFYINHDFLLEKDLWARLHEENIIKLYQQT